MFRKVTWYCLLLEVVFLGSGIFYLFYNESRAFDIERSRDVSVLGLQDDVENCKFGLCDIKGQTEEEEKTIEVEKHIHRTSKTRTVSDSSLAMKDCPDGWPLEILEVSENGDPTVQRCRSETGDGSWKCADGWIRVETSPFCVLKSSKDTKNEDSRVGNLTRAPYPDYAPISKDKKLLFVHVPKAGGIRIETSFLFQDQRERLGHYLGGHHKITSFDKNYFKDYHKFCMVRHPCSRLVSVWEGFSRGLGNTGDRDWVELNLDEASRTSFDVFIEHSLYPGGPIHVEAEIHLQTQVGMLFDENGKFGLDQILVFERWYESLDELERKIKTNVTALKMSHRTKGRYKSCQEMYNPTTWEKLVKIYALDFCVLGYSTKLEETGIFPPVDLTPETMTKRFKKCEKELTAR